MTENETNADTTAAGSEEYAFEGEAASERRCVDLSERQYSIFRCQDCENVVLTMRDCEGEMTCHGERMEPVEDVELAVKPPDIRQLLLDAFGLPKPGLDICLCVIDEGPVATSDVADTLDYDESTVRRYLNELVDLGLLEQTQLNREEGGFVNVYHSIDLAEMRTETLIGFYAWAGEAATLIEAANRTKTEHRNRDGEKDLASVFWDRFGEGE